MNIPSWFTLQSEKPKLLTETDLRKIHEIEQDMWAEWIWEYVKCHNCSKIHSKKDIFWHVSKDIYKETVWRLEQILALDSIKCTDCGSDTESIWWEDYIEEIRERYGDEESFLTTYRDATWEIRGFTDAYINDFETIYKREFEYYYFIVWPDKIKGMIEKLISWKLPEKLLMHSTVWIEVRYSSLKVFLVILKKFYYYLLINWYKDVLWIYESSIWTTIHWIYHVVGTKRVWLTIWNNYWNLISNTSWEIISDIFIHPNIVSSFNKKLSISVKTFMKENSLKMKEVLNK